MTSIPRVAAAGFAVAADVYERARPGYPAAAVEWLAERLRIEPGRTVLDLAAGTGKLTRSLVPLGARVVAVEPVDAMRAKLRETVPEAEALAGTAETIPLRDGAVDAVVVAQAFHWFDAHAALAEVHRVLAPGGGIGLIWNSRDDDDELNRRTQELLAPHQGEVQRHYDLDVEGELERSARFGPVDTRTWPYKQRVDLEMFVDRIASTSYVADLASDRREALLDEFRALGRGAGDPLVIRYVTQVFAADRR
ncbi:MAG TPA: class I SAM-dependent methyltransferase [Gaiellaceae bacterium]|nr:class I SAM-dependent methyltransferase [Gaiellaceae bacterium]